MTHPTLILDGPGKRAQARTWLERAPEGYAVIFKAPNRTDDQNSKLWPMLTDLSRQVEWYGQRLAPHEWKDVLTAGLRKSKVVPGIDGGVVILGQRTSTMSKAEFSELIELIYAFGAERGVQWTDPQERAA